MCFRVKSPFRMVLDAGYLGTKGTGLATGRRQWTAVARGWYGCLHHSARIGRMPSGLWPPPGFGITIRYIGRLSIGMFAVVLTTCV